MEIIGADLSEHHQRWHLGLEIRDEMDVSGDNGEQIHPPGSWRRQEQRREKNCGGRPDCGDAGGRKPERDPDDAADVVARRHQEHRRGQPGNARHSQGLCVPISLPRAPPVRVKPGSYSETSPPPHDFNDHAAVTPPALES